MAKGKKKPASAKAREQARAAARAEAERLKAAQAAKERRNRLLVLAGGLAVVVAVAVIVIAVTMSQKGDAFADLPATPAGAQENGGILLGTDLAPGGPAPEGNDVVTVAIYTDFMCPWCGNFEKQYDQELSNLAQNGQIQLEYHIVALQDSQENAERFSTRAAIAAAAVAKHDPANFLPFVRAMFDDQPTEGQDSRSDEEIAATAEGAGVNEGALAALTNTDFEAWVNFTNEQFFKVGVSTTPTIMMALGSGERMVFTDYSTIGFEQAVANVRNGSSPSGQ
ncbi:MAG: DsbA family protein [Micrococcales bacterium]|nr:DsbA family protein [Micrococcales bacterium]